MTSGLSNMTDRR